MIKDLFIALKDGRVPVTSVKFSFGLDFADTNIDHTQSHGISVILRAVID